MKSGRHFFLGTVVAAALAAVMLPDAVRAQAVQRIAAIVNDELITAYDLESRMKLVILSTRLPNTVEVRRRIRSQVLRSLIDERLQMQEAKRRNISVSKRDLRRAKTTIENQNKLPKDGLERILRQNEVPLSAMEEQLRAGIAWSKLVGRRLRPRITIGEDEIDEALDRIKSRQGQTEYRLAEILLAVDGPEEEDNVRRTADRIRTQLQNGANFAAIARQFSQSATAAVGGDLGWVHEAELGDDLKDLVPSLRRGAISQPIKTVTGYRLLTLQGSRKIAETESKPETVDLRQIFLPFPRAATPIDVEAQIDLAKTVRDTATGCPDFDLLAKEIQSPRPPNLGRFALKDLSPAIRAVVRDVPAGKISDPVKMPGGVLVLMVCSREGGKGEIKLPERDAIADRLMQERLALMARRYLRDIRLSAVIDIRV
ncbi:MAG: peptidylprolyl isomerase [Alphaproteobacteria bacterium]